MKPKAVHLLDVYRLAIDDVVPFEKKELKLFIYRCLDRAFSDLPKNLHKKSEFEQQEYITSATNKFKENLSSGDKDHQGVDIKSREIEDILFSLNRALIVMMLKQHAAFGTQLQYLERIKIGYTELQFKNSHNDFYVQEFGNIIQFIDDNILGIKSQLPQSSKAKVAFFKTTMNDETKKSLANFLTTHKYTDQPKVLTEFFCGVNPLTEIFINTDKITDTAYLLSLMHKEGVITVKGSGGYIQLFERHTCPFGSKWANGQVYNESRKYKRNKDVKGKPIDDFLSSLVTRKK